MSRLVEQAKEMGTAAHFGQMYGKAHYAVHLQQVENEINFLATFIGFDSYELEVLRAGAWLHDAFEDTDIDKTKVKKLNIALYRAVESVTDGEGATRKERKQKVYHAIAADYLGAILKIADRVANVKNLGKLEMYREEQIDLAAAVIAGGNKKALAALLYLEGVLHFASFARKYKDEDKNSFISITGRSDTQDDSGFPDSLFVSFDEGSRAIKVYERKN